MALKAGIDLIGKQQQTRAWLGSSPATHGGDKIYMTIKRLFLICGGVFLAASQTQAGTRDDVIAGVERCGVIHDDRVWLDCVYGAQQPMRAQLGLPPAPEFQQRLVPPAGTMMPAQIGTATPVTGIAARPAPPRKKAGFFATLIGAAPPVTVSRMMSYRYDKNGAFIVTLDNGQEWRQTDVVGGTASWLKAPASYKVTISQGAFGSYSLSTDDSPRAFKVERVN
jgi:hypothetical protein